MSKAIATGKASLGSVCSSTCTASLKGHWHGAVRRTSLLAERKELASGEATDNDGKVVSATEASEVIASIDTKLAALAREQVILEQVPRRLSKFRLRRRPTSGSLKDAALAVLGRMMQLRGLGKQLKKAEANVRRMRE